jgi:hypothetical protein
MRRQSLPDVGVKAVSDMKPKYLIERFFSEEVGLDKNFFPVFPV